MSHLLLKENVVQPGYTFHQDQPLSPALFLRMVWVRPVNCAWMPMPHVSPRSDWRPLSSIIVILGQVKESHVAWLRSQASLRTGHLLLRMFMRIKTSMHNASLYGEPRLEAGTSLSQRLRLVVWLL